MSELSWAEIANRFNAAQNWWVATGGAGGPHAVPVWGVVLDEQLVVYGDPGSVRGRNLAADPRAVLHLESGTDVLIVHGVVRDWGPAGARERVSAAFARKYAAPDDLEYLPDAPANTGSVLWRVEPTRAIAWLLSGSEMWRTRRWRA